MKLLKKNLRTNKKENRLTCIKQSTSSEVGNNLETILWLYVLSEVSHKVLNDKMDGRYIFYDTCIDIHYKFINIRFILIYVRRKFVSVQIFKKI